jgi:hypothetical protein
VLVEFEDVLDEFDFLVPEKVVWVEVEVVEAFLGEAFAWHEVGWMGW